MSASANKPWKRTWKRAKLQGGGKRERTEGSSRSDNVAALLGRLRRLEVVVMHLTMRLKLSSEELDKLLSAMLEASHVSEPRSGGENRGIEVQIPHEGSSDGETEEQDDTEI